MRYLPLLLLLAACGPDPEPEVLVSTDTLVVTDSTEVVTEVTRVDTVTVTDTLVVTIVQAPDTVWLTRPEGVTVSCLRAEGVVVCGSEFGTLR